MLISFAQLQAGEHFDPDSVKYHKAFVWLSLIYGGLISEKEIPDLDKHHATLSASNVDLTRVFEVRYRKGVTPEEGFKMKQGYANLQPVQQGESLAHSNNETIKAVETGRIFMPLYQEKGDDGFFLVREVSPFWLCLSAILRTWKFENLLKLLPGVNTDRRDKHTLVVNKHISRFLGAEVFHLLGDRTKKREEDKLLITKLEFDVRGIAKKQ